MLFSDRSIWTMVHGIVFGGGVLLALAAALYHLLALRPATGHAADPGQGRALSILLVAIAVLMWMAVVGGTYVVFPLYRIPPPEGLADLARHPRALLMSRPDTRWLHAFAMEIKEHWPWIAAMVATAAAVVGRRYRRLPEDAGLRRLLIALTLVGFAIVSGAALLGVFINKVAPVE